MFIHRLFFWKLLRIQAVIEIKTQLFTFNNSTQCLNKFDRHEKAIEKNSQFDYRPGRFDCHLYHHRNIDII